ncbi:MAG: polysaccharide biosynthesis protein [Planctomycetaceae bacterium]|nr:polysaccharide biosynthesis protein [Planctomycetaceae bacterium]
MAITPLSSSRVRPWVSATPASVPPLAPGGARPEARVRPGPAPRRIASNFAWLSLAEVICRGTSVAVTLALAKRLGPAGYGRVELAFNIVFWLVLLVRDAFEVITSRELARHPRLIRPLVNHVLAIKGAIALGLFAALVMIGRLTLSTPSDRAILTLYGLLLVTTALGLDFVYRSTERMGLVALSLCIRTLVYAGGVWFWVSDASRIVWVPAWLALGEASGIALVWTCYARRYGLPRPHFGVRFLRILLRRGRSVCLIQAAQTVIGSADLMVVGLMSRWEEIGCYGAPYRMISAILTFGVIFQQAAFPTLARSWRQAPGTGRASLNALVKVLAGGLLPVAVGGTVLAAPLVRFLLSTKYAEASLLLALGIWRAPLLTVAFLYQAMLIAVNREASGVRLLLAGAVASGPLALALHTAFGLPGALMSVLVIGASLVLAGFACLAREGREPAWHHHLARPLVASAVMVPVCLLLQRWHVLAAVAGGAATYAFALSAVGGIRPEDVRAILGRGQTHALDDPTPGVMPPRPEAASCPRFESPAGLSRPNLVNTA